MKKKQQKKQQQKNQQPTDGKHSETSPHSPTFSTHTNEWVFCSAGPDLLTALTPPPQPVRNRLLLWTVSRDRSSSRHTEREEEKTLKVCIFRRRRPRLAGYQHHISLYSFNVFQPPCPSCVRFFTVSPPLWHSTPTVFSIIYFLLTPLSYFLFFVGVKHERASRESRVQKR